MRVILDSSLFTSATIEQLSLLECIALGRDERHVILCEPPFEPDGDEQVNKWLAQHEPTLRAELMLILDQANEASMGVPLNTKTIRVVAGQDSKWPRAHLCLQDAARLLREPLHILLEDAINDLAFLLRLAPSGLRERLTQALEHGWVVVDHAGGVDGIRRIVSKLDAQDTSTLIKRMRYWIMFDRDSDSRDRAQADPKTERLHQLLNQQSADALYIKHYRLERRAIENYIPNAALERWANAARGPTIDQRHKTRKALELLRQANHLASCQYNMKGGLHSDLDEKHSALFEQLNAQRLELRGNLTKLASLLVDDHCDPIFRGCAALDRAALTFGFGSNIAAIYSDDAHDDFEQSFQDEYDRGQHSMTREQIIEQILQSL